MHHHTLADAAAVLARLTDAERRTVLLLADRDVADVAVAEGTTPAAIYQRRYRAKLRLGRPLGALRFGRKAR